MDSFQLQIVSSFGYIYFSENVFFENKLSKLISYSYSYILKIFLRQSEQGEYISSEKLKN